MVCEVVWWIHLFNIRSSDLLCEHGNGGVLKRRDSAKIVSEIYCSAR
jgi:hypothetical protein